jgi:ATP-dependent 26S proteasome regulatory subunit
MSINDFMITNMLFTSFGKVNTGYIIIDILYVMITSTLILYFLTPNFKNRFFKKIGEFVSGFASNFDSTNRIIFSASDKESSKRYRSIMHYISKSNEPTVKCLSEIVDWKSNWRTDEYEECKNSVYRVDQFHKFIIDKQMSIEGKVYIREKERSEFNGKSNITEYNCLEIFSKKTKLVDLEKWIDKRADEYNQYIKTKSCDKQQLVEISWNPEEKDLDIYYNIWESNVTFENRFFENKDEILSKINFFIKNPEWYKKRGIPYTLGFLLWGEPGCGKTGFIKALMNLTGRHGISIKLNNKFNMNRLREIMYDDEIYEDLIIPQQNRILIFEDIDCMGEVVKDRDSNEKKELVESIRCIQKEKNKEYISILDPTNGPTNETTNETNFNNNLSFFLNILDGLQECPGRIIIMTTNKPETLDKALIRPGRIDHNIHFTKAVSKDIKDIIQFYWNEQINDLPVGINKVYSHAEIINYCRTSESVDETIRKLCINSTSNKTCE